MVQDDDEISFYLKVLIFRIIGFFKIFYDCSILLSQALDIMLEKSYSKGFHDSWLYHKVRFFFFFKWYVTCLELIFLA